MTWSSSRCEWNSCSIYVKLALTAVLLIAAVLALNSRPVEAKPVDRKKETRNFLKPAELAQIEASILRFTNLERVRKGLKELKSSNALTHVAKKQSLHMCDSKILAHESDVFPEGWRKLIQRMQIAHVKSGAENVALRTVESDLEDWARKIVEGWMKSAPHKKNILEPTFRYVGIAVVPCEEKIAYVTQMFSSDIGNVL